MRKYRFLLSFLTLAGNLTLIGLTLRDRLRPIFPVLRFVIPIRKDLLGIWRELRRINSLISH